MEEKKTNPTKPEEKKEPKFWKGNTENAFAYSIMIGFFVGAANMIFLHWGWHPGIVSMVLIFLIVGTNPAFADKRTPASFLEIFFEKRHKKIAPRRC